MTTPPDLDLDLDAVNAAAAEGAGTMPPVVFGGDEYPMPAGLPADVLQPLLPLLGPLYELFGPLLDEGNEDPLPAVVGALAAGLPERLLAALDEAGRRLFDGLDVLPVGESHWESFKANRPTVQVYVALATRLGRRYGVGLGELLGSVRSLQLAGQTSNATLPSTTNSTRSRSGAGQKRRAG